MFDKDTVLSCFESLVGFRQDSNAIYDTLDDALKASDSGIYVNDLPGISFENISANLSTDAADANDYLLGVYESEVLNLVNQFVNKAKQNYNSKELLANQTLASGVASKSDLVVKNQRFVGYWMRPHRSGYMKTQILSLGFQSTQTQDALKIYLYETSQIEPIKTFSFPITKEYSLTWSDVTDWILDYESLNGGTGQDYLLGYYEDNFDNPQDTQLQGQALYMTFDCNCSNSPKTLWDRFVGVKPIEINSNYLNWNGSDFDIPLVDNVGDFVTNQTYGLNAKIRVYCDISTVLCNNKLTFARALQHAIASRILYDFWASNRINSISDSKRDQALSFAKKYDGVLNGYTTPEGVKIRGLIDSLTVDFSEMDKYCLPCRIGISTGRLIR